MRLPRASVHVALASAASLAAQALFSLLLLQSFTPQAVGEFSVISQIAFFWSIMALAQSPLSLLADIRLPATRALRDALRCSLMRLALLLPLAAVGVALSGHADMARATAWAMLLALLQLCWSLAQPFTLRVATARSIALGRALPPVVALVLAALVGAWLPHAGADALTLAAASGYAVGALWLLPARRAIASQTREVEVPNVDAPPRPEQGDDRGTTLRLAHTAMDALAGTAILLVWQRSHGAAEAGHLAVLLRVLGFVPAVIYAAWAQVLLAQGTTGHEQALKAGLVGAALSAAMGLACALAIRMEWLQPAWAGLMPYLAPLVLWQACACLLAAYSHRPFQRGRASAYSYAAMGFDGLQIIVLAAPVVLSLPLSATAHAWWLAGASAAGLLGLSLWLARLPSRPNKH